MDHQQYNHLVHGLKAKDENALNELYDYYSGALYGIVLRMVQNEELAADCLQEAFIKIWNNGHQFDENKGRLFTWMSRLTRNTTLNYLDSKNYRNHSKIQSDENIVSIDKREPARIHSDTMDIKGLVSAMDSKYSSLIDLIYFQGYTQKEVSDELGLPLGTVKTRVKTAMQKLRKKYDIRAESIAVGIFLTLMHIN